MGLVPNKRFIPKEAMVLPGVIDTSAERLTLHKPGNSIRMDEKDPGFSIRLIGDSELHLKNNMDNFQKEIILKVKELETKTGRVFGDAVNSLLLGITYTRRERQSSVEESIPFIGLGDSTIPGLCITNDPRKVYESYCRLIMHYAQQVIGTATCRSAHTSKVMIDRMENRLNQWKARKGYQEDTELTASDWANLAGTFKAMIQVSCGRPFPDDPRTQLHQIVLALMQQPSEQPISSKAEQPSDLQVTDLEVSVMSL